MKKFLGAIISGAAGVLGFILMSLDWATLKIKSLVLGKNVFNESYTGWDLIKDANDAMSEMDGYMIYKIFAIIMLVISALLIVFAVIMLLKSLGIIKGKFNLSAINNILLTLFLVCSIVAIIGLVIMGNDFVDANTVENLAKASYVAGVGLWLTLATGVIATALGWSLARKD